MAGGAVPEGTVREVALPAGSRPRFLAPAPDDSVWVTLPSAHAVGVCGPDFGFRSFPVRDDEGNPLRPWHIACGPDGNLWFTVEGRSELRRIAPDGAVSRPFRLPKGVQPGELLPWRDGRIYFPVQKRPLIGAIRVLPVPAGGLAHGVASLRPGEAPPDWARPFAAGEGKSTAGGGEAKAVLPAALAAGGWSVELPRPRPARAATRESAGQRHERLARCYQAAWERQVQRSLHDPEEEGPREEGMAAPVPGLVGAEPLGARPGAAPVDAAPDLAEDPLDDLGVNLPGNTIEHILSRHGRGRMRGKSQFMKRFSDPRAIRDLIARGLRSVWPVEPTCAWDLLG